MLQFIFTWWLWIVGGLWSTNRPVGIQRMRMMMMVMMSVVMKLLQMMRFLDVFVVIFLCFGLLFLNRCNDVRDFEVY